MRGFSLVFVEPKHRPLISFGPIADLESAELHIAAKARAGRWLFPAPIDLARRHRALQKLPGCQGRREAALEIQRQEFMAQNPWSTGCALVDFG